MEQDSQHLCSSNAPVISRLDRLDRLLHQWEKRQILLPRKKYEGEVDKQCKPLSCALEEVHSKGTLMERLAVLENRMLQLGLEMEDGSTSNSSTSTKPDVEKTNLHIPTEQDDEKLMNCIQKQEQIPIQGDDSKQVQKIEKKSRRRKKTSSSFTRDKRLFWVFPNAMLI